MMKFVEFIQLKKISIDSLWAKHSSRYRNTTVGKTSPCLRGPPGGVMVKNLPADAGDTRDAALISGLGRSLEVGNGNPL